LDTEPTVPEFLSVAVDFVNRKLSGSLKCTLLCDTASQQAHSEVVERALDELQFGSISLNCGFSAVSYPQLIWGAYPRHTIHDIQSGCGKLGNVYCLNDLIKSVIRAPFMSSSLVKFRRMGRQRLSRRVEQPNIVFTTMCIILPWLL